MGEREGWGLSPAGWALVYAAAGIELATIVGLWRPLGTLGVVRLPASVVPGLLLLAVFGSRLFAETRCWVPFFLWAGAIAAVPVWGFHHLFGGFGGVCGFVLAALHEEVVFRAAFPLIVWRLLHRAGADRGWSRAGAILIPAVLFAVLPNHLRQAGSLLGVVPFFTFAVLFGLLVRRPNVLPAAALAHLAVNLLTIPVAFGVVSPMARTLAVATLLGGFAFVALFMAEPGIPAGDPDVGSWDPIV
jgi:membrane protease YdiL (CAAX protease family)